MPKKKIKLPAQRKDLPDELKEKLDEINDRWDNHPFVKNYHGRWEEYIAWFEGDQYKVYNELSEKLEDLKPMVERETKNVYNRIMPLIRQMWGELRYPHEFYLIPNTSEAEDVRAAYVGSQLIEFTNEVRKFSKKINRAKLWALICGVCFWKEWWNKNLVGSVKGNKKNKTAPENGDIDYDFVNPFNCRPDPDSMNREDWGWFIEGKKTPNAAVEAEFNIEPGSLPAQGKQSAEINIFERKSIGIHSYEESKVPSGVRKETWETKTDDHSKGRFFVTWEDWMLWEGPNPAPRAQIPYFLIPGIVPILGEQAYDSAVRIAQPAQRMLNRYCSMVDEHIQHWKIKGMIPWGSLRPGDENAFTRSGVDYVTYNSRFGQPYYQTPPPLPDFLATWLGFQEKEIETGTSVREVSYARLPKYASRASGVLFEGLKQQDEAVLIPAVEEQDMALQEAASFRLEIIQENYSEKRLVKTVGKNRRHTISFFEGADLRDNRDVRVVPGVDILTSKKRKEDVVNALVEKGYIKEPREAFELLGIKTVEEFWEDEFTDERQAYRQLAIMKEGDSYITPHEHDNHEVHYLIFNNARKAEDFETLPKKVKKNIERRVEEESSFVVTAPEEGAAAAAPVAPEAAAAGAAAAPPVTAAPGPAAVSPTSPNPPATMEEIYMALLAQMGQGGY